MQRGIRKTIVSTSKKYPLEPRLIALGWPNRYKFFLAPLRIHFYRYKSTLYSLKSLFEVFRRKLSLGAPASSCTSNCTSSSKKKIYMYRLKVVGSRLVGTKKVYISQRPDISSYFLPSLAWHKCGKIRPLIHYFPSLWTNLRDLRRLLFCLFLCYAVTRDGNRYTVNM